MTSIDGWICWFFTRVRRLRVRKSKRTIDCWRFDRLRERRYKFCADQSMVKYSIRSSTVLNNSLFASKMICLALFVCCRRFFYSKNRSISFQFISCHLHSVCKWSLIDHVQQRCKIVDQFHRKSQQWYHRWDQETKRDCPRNLHPRPHHHHHFDWNHCYEFQ